MRLSLATYRVHRVVRIGSVVSRVVQSLGGISAGSGFATTEMRFVMGPLVDAALCRFPRVITTVFADDLLAEMLGPKKHVLKELGGFIEEIVKSVAVSGVELFLLHCIAPQTLL